MDELKKELLLLKNNGVDPD